MRTALAHAERGPVGEEVDRLVAGYSTAFNDMVAYLGHHAALPSRKIIPSCPIERVAFGLAVDAIRAKLREVIMPAE